MVTNNQNYIPYDPNEDEERSSAESYTTPRNVTQPKPVTSSGSFDDDSNDDVYVEPPRASDPFEDVSPAESYVEPPQVVEEFREEIREQESLEINPDYFINPEERIIDPRKLEELEKETESFDADQELYDRQLAEYEEGKKSLETAIEFEQEKIDEAEAELDAWFDENYYRRADDSFWAEYESRFEAITPLYEDRDKNFEMYENFIGKSREGQPQLLGDSDLGNLAFLDDRFESVEERRMAINKEWQSIGSDPFYYPPEILGADPERDIYGPSDVPEQGIILERPSDIFDRDLPDEDKLDRDFVYEDMAEDERFVEALGDRETGTFNWLPQKQETFILETGGDILNRDIPTVPPAFAFTEPEYEQQQVDPFLPERGKSIGGMGVKGAKAISDLLMLTRLYEGIKNIPNFEVLNIDMSGKKNPYTGLPVEIKKRDEDQGWSDIDDYAIGLSVQAYGLARYFPAVGIAEDFANTVTPSGSKVGFSFDRKSDRDIYQNVIKPLARRPDSYRNEKPFGTLSFHSQEGAEKLGLYKERGRSPYPWDDNFNINMMSNQLDEFFRPIDLALTIAQVNFLASITKGSIVGLVKGIRNAPARINQGRKLIARNIPDTFLSADQVANKIIAKSYIANRKKEQQLARLTEDLTFLYNQAGKITNKPRNWVYMKVAGKSPVEYHEEVFTNAMNTTKKHNLGAVKGKLKKLVDDGRATPKQKEVLDIIDNRLPLPIAQANKVNPLHDEWLKAEDSRFFLRNNPIFTNALDDKDAFLTLDETFKIKNNLDYLDKRYEKTEWWKKFTQEQKENFASKLEGQKTLYGQYFDFNKGTIGAGKLSEEAFLEPDKIRLIESVLDFNAIRIPKNKNFKSYDDIIFGENGMAELIESVKGFGPQYLDLYNLDEVAKIIQKINKAVFSPSKGVDGGDTLLSQITRSGRGARGGKTPKDTLRVDESKLENLIDDFDDWMKNSRKDGRFRRRVDDELADSKSEIFKDSPDPFFAVSVQGQGGLSGTGTKDFSQGKPSGGATGPSGGGTGKGRGSGGGGGVGTAQSSSSGSGQGQAKGQGSGSGTGSGRGQGSGQGQGQGQGRGTGQGTAKGTGTGQGTGQGTGAGGGSGTGTGTGEGIGEGRGVGSGTGTGQGQGQGQGQGTGQGTGTGTGSGTGTGQGTGQGTGTGTGSGRGSGRGTGQGQGQGQGRGRGRGTGRGSGGSGTGGRPSGKPKPTKGKPKKTDLQGTPPPVTPEEPREGFITKLYPKKVQWRQADDVYVNVDLNTGELDVTDIAIGSGVKQGFGTESMKVIKRSRRKPRLLRKGATADDIKMDDVEKMILQNTISQKRNLRFK